MIFETPRLGGREREVITRVLELKDKLRVHLRVKRRWTGLLRRSMLGRAMRGSNSIEGYTIGLQDVVDAAEGGVVDANEETRLALAGYRRAMTYVLSLAEDKHFGYSTNLIKSLHFMMLEHDLDQRPGNWRLGDIYVVDEEHGPEKVYAGPDADLVNPLMEELVVRVQEEVGGVPDTVRAAMAHLNMVMIHPFKDGNGRMARCVQTLVLSQGGTLEPQFCSIEERLGEYQRDYYDVLAQVGQGSWHPENDALPWVKFCLRMHFIQAQALVRRTSEIANLYEALEAEVLKRGLPERLTFALADAAQRYKVRNSTYRTIAGIPEQLASRDLKLLVDAGLLFAEGEKRGRYYVAAPSVLELYDRIKEPVVREDPFAEPATKPSAIATATGTSIATVSVKKAPSSTGQQPPA